MPNIEIDRYSSVCELTSDSPECYYHYFVTLNLLLTDMPFFKEHKKKTIVLTTSRETQSVLDRFHCLNVNVSEPVLIKSLLSLEQRAHADNDRIRPLVSSSMQKVLSEREVEVLILIVQGFLNKEIADKLSISLSTVITHRKNIMDKLKRKSIGALTIYAVMNGYVNVNDIDGHKR